MCYRKWYIWLLQRGVVETPLCNRLHARQPGGDCMMDPAYLSAFAALAGSTIGGLTSLTASWLTQHVQFRASMETQDAWRPSGVEPRWERSRTSAHSRAHSHTSPGWASAWRS